MNQGDIAVVEFISASTAGIVYAELGFIPDFAILIQDHGGTNPNIRIWARGGTGKTFPLWPAALGLLITGSTGVITRDTASIAEYAGGDTIASAETANTDGKHVTRDGAPGVAGHITAPGVSIPAAEQTNSGRNLLLAWRYDL